MESRQVRRARERRKKKLESGTYPLKAQRSAAHRGPIRKNRRRRYDGNDHFDT